MNWEAIGALGEVVGAFGAIATPLYLAYQIQQNTAQLEQSILTARASAVIEQLRYRLVMQNVTEAMLEIFSQTSVTNSFRRTVDGLLSVGRA